MSIRNHAKVYELTKELCGNNRMIGTLNAKTKGIKDEVKAFQERNVVIMDELKVHTEDDFNTDTN